MDAERKNLSTPVYERRRRRPTASNRRLRAAQQEAGPSDMPEEQELYADVPQEQERQAEQAEILMGPFPGSPYDPSLLRTFKIHVATDVWNVNKRGVLKCLCHTSKLLKWVYPEDETIRVWRSYVKRSELHNLSKISYRAPNRNLISAFFERWQPETNTFNLPFSEMTITLDDVLCLLGLPVVGQPVHVEDDPSEFSPALIHRLLGVSVEDVILALNDKRGQSVKLEWLHSTFLDSYQISQRPFAEKAARAYILYILGCTIFSDKSGTRITAGYLKLLEDTSVVREYAWGAAALAYLYRQLGFASRSGVKQIAGYLTLLEAWTYEHFPTSPQPQFNVEYDPRFPLAMRWSQHGQGGANTLGLQACREWLDSLQPHEVNWDPYQQVRDRFQRPEVTFYHGCIKALDIVEPYHPDRVLRQFGHVQHIPLPPLDPDYARRGKNPGKYVLAWGVLGPMFLSWDSHILSMQRRGRLVEPIWETVPEYLDWYRTFSHPQVQNPDHTSAARHFSIDANPSQLWARNVEARNILDPLVRMWTTHDPQLSFDYVMPRVEQAARILHGLTLDDGHESDE